MADAPGLALETQRDVGWVRLDPAGGNPGFSELREAVFRTPGVGDLRLLVDDQPLERADSGAWKWTPGYYAGPVRAELLAQDGSALGQWTLTVSPDDKKLARDPWAQMVEEIRRHDPTLLVGAEPARHRLGALGKSDDPLVALERLRRRESGLRRAIAAIHREPRSVLRPRRAWTPLHCVRRADLRTLRIALREPAVLAALPDSQTPDGVGASGQPFVDVPANERSLDTPANRAALFMLRALRRRADRVLDRLRGEAHRDLDAETRTALKTRLPRWQEVLARMSRTFGRAERKSPFQEAQRPEITAAGLNAVAAHPLYEQFWRLGWEALRRGIHHEGADDLPLTTTWEIYERWCFVELSRRVRDLLPREDWRETPTSEDGDRRTVRFDGPRGAEITLYLQKTASRAATGLRSVSCQCVPDLVLRWEGGGTRPGFVVLDAKYRASRQRILAGMAESAHLYQDALRWGGERPDATLLLVPDTRQVEWLADREFIEQNRVGAIRLLPNAKLPDWFSQFMLDRLHWRLPARERLRHGRGAGTGSRTTDEIMELTRGED